MISTLCILICICCKKRKKKTENAGKLWKQPAVRRPFRGSEDTGIQQNKHGCHTTKRLITNDR
jgi:hypothetical protein